MSLLLRLRHGLDMKPGRLGHWRPLLAFAISLVMTFLMLLTTQRKMMRTVKSQENIFTGLEVNSRSSSTPTGTECQFQCCFAKDDKALRHLDLVNLPSYSYDRKLYIISTSLSLRKGSVAVLVTVPSESLYEDAYPRIKKAGILSYNFRCTFDAAEYFNSPGIVHVDTVHSSVVQCKLPPKLATCMGRMNGRSGKFVAQCITLRLLVQWKFQKNEPTLLARLKVCQLDSNRSDTLVMCSQPISKAIWWDVPEWLVYHAMVGIEHFYLYTVPGSSEGLRHILRPSIQEGMVSIKPWMSQDWLGREVHLQQISAQNDCLYALKDHSEWIAFFDVDEFLFSSRYSQDLRQVLLLYTSQSVIMVQSFLFRRPKTSHGREMLALSGVERGLNASVARPKFICKVGLTWLLAVHWPQQPYSGNVSHADASILKIHHLRAIEFSGPDRPANWIRDTSLVDFAGSEVRKRLKDTYRWWPKV